MGKIGDVSGKVGDVSGLGVEGKVGDVSGAATFQEVQNLIMEDRRNEGLGCLERKVDRLQFELMALARWLDLRMQYLREEVATVKDNISNQSNTLKQHEKRIRKLEGSGSGSPMTLALDDDFTTDKL